MFYTGNDNYMQDLYCYNQIPNLNKNLNVNPNQNQNSNFNLSMNTYPNMNGFQNNMNMNNIGAQASSLYSNLNIMQNEMNQINGFYSLYPSIYKILMPVIVRVLQNSNYQFLNEDVLNNMVDTVYNIVDGQIEYNDDPNNILNNYTVSNDSSNSNSANNHESKTNTNTNDTKEKNINDSNSNKDNTILKDLIKILILREIIKRVTLGTFLF